MKRFLSFVLLLALAKNGFAQILHYDFSAVCETGQTLYYLITSEQEQTAMLTHPFSEENLWFTGDNYYDGFPEPQGEIILPTTVYYNDTPYSVTAVGDNAFNNCRDLSGTLTIPEGILSLGSRAFRSCGFTALVIPQSLEVIVSSDNGYGTAFVYCGSLEAISVHDGNPIFYSENNAIIRRENKTLVVGCKATTIPDDVETIGRSAFQGSGDGGDLVIPNSVTTIEDYAFYESRFSGTITFPDSLRNIGVKAFSYCLISGSLTIPDSVTEIRNYTFSDCSRLTGALRLSNALAVIGKGAFNNTSFVEIHSPNATPPAFRAAAFNHCDLTIPVYIPFGCTEAYQNTEGWDCFTNFIETGTNLEGEWYYEILNADGSVTYQHLEYVADTTIGNERPKIIVRTNQIYDKDRHTEVTHEYIYESNGKVYWWNKTMEEFTTLYDYRAEVGDEWDIKVGNETITVHVDAVDESYVFDGVNYRVLHISDANDIFCGTLVCGVGHLTSFFPERLMTQGKNYRVKGLRCYWLNGFLTLKYGDEDCDAIYEQYHHNVDETDLAAGIRIYPNPTNGLLHIVETEYPPSLPLEYRITNIMGQTLLTGTVARTIDVSSLPVGMYFITLGHQTLKFTKQ